MCPLFFERDHLSQVREDNEKKQKISKPTISLDEAKRPVHTPGATIVNLDSSMSNMNCYTFPNSIPGVFSGKFWCFFHSSLIFLF